ncbi:MAG TPA: hypothetical protein VN626_07450 [Clostridia bacterium]|nr:hypothetical protein [Clostridia bacterium]
MRRFVLAALLLLFGCAQTALGSHTPTYYPDGVYRGTYYDYSTEQLAVEFEMKNQQFESIRLIGMRYRDGDYLKSGATQAQQAIVSQYQTAASYLLQKGVGSLTDLYKKSSIIPDVDAVTGATLKTSVLVSAIYDGLSRMPYSWGEDKDVLFKTPVCDGSYRGFFYENGIERIAISFDLKDGVFNLLKIRSLKDEQGEDSEETGSIYQTVNHCLAYLENKPLAALAELDGVVAKMPDGDNQMAGRLRSAILGGMSRAPFRSGGTVQFFERFSVEDGTYRGHYYDKGIEQLSVQFEVENGLLHNISLRGKQENLSENVQLEKYKYACSLLEGKPIATVNSLYGVSDASFEAGELTYAIADALARGLYKPSSASLLPAVQTAANGVWAGSFQSDSLGIEVALQLEQGYIGYASLTGLKINADSFGEEEQARLLLTGQLEQLAGKNLAQINELYRWEHPLSVPLISALWDAVETI